MTIYIISASIFGLVVGWLMAKVLSNQTLQNETQKSRTLELELASLRATSEQQIITLNHVVEQRNSDLSQAQKSLESKNKENTELQNDYSTNYAELRAAKQTILEKNEDI